LRIRAYDRAGLLRDVTALLDDAHLFILALHSGDTQDGIASIEVSFEVSGMDSLHELIGRLEQLPNIIDVCRVTD
jgi:GTP pyrophosphokinase